MLGEVWRRLNALEQEVDELRELVDGQESWSHRKRLHTLEGDHHAAELVRQALDELRQVRTRRSNMVREWGSFAIAISALLVAVLHAHGTL